MKRIVTLFICCLMLFGTVAFAEDTAYSKLNDLEKEIYDCFMIMVSNFHKDVYKRQELYYQYIIPLFYTSTERYNALLRSE